VLSLDDYSNNQLLDSGVASYILNPISAYRSASADLQQKIYISIWPGGPKGRQMIVNASTWAIPTWTKEQGAAQKFLVDYYDQYLESFKASTGYNFPLLKGFQKKPMPILGDSPKYSVDQDASNYYRASGYPGKPTPAAGEAEANWVVPLMVARAVGDNNFQSAMEWAEQKLQAIYDKYK